MEPASPPRATVASFYARHLALTDGGVLEWTDHAPPRLIPIDAVHVTVARDACYAIDRSGHLLQWSAPVPEPRVIAEGIAYAAAGESSMLAITQAGLLLKRTPTSLDWTAITAGVRQAWVGDSSDYYVTTEGRLYVSGLAHRGQYGDGLLTAVDGWKTVADDVVYACAHTGHAVLLKTDGTVEGTGGNRFGPLRSHGHGDKADRWGRIYEGAVRIATGARHTAAIRADGSLWLWGEHVGLVPVRVLEGVTDVACGEQHVLARTQDHMLWFWPVSAPPARLAR